MFLAPLLAVAWVGPIKQDFALGPAPLLLRHPTVNKTSIVFKFADNLWKVPREGGDAVRLTSTPGIVGDPFFSPDGREIAFSADYGGHDNVYVLPEAGGTPRRLTAHPSPETVVGWTPDSRFVVFSSRMLSDTDHPRLFKVRADGGYPEPLPLPTGSEATYSPDGSHLAYVPVFHRQTAWKRYRGGQAYRIWIADLADSRVKEIPRKNWNDDQPVWFGSKVYYLSDRTGPVGLYSYDPVSGRERPEVPGRGFDMKSLTAGPDVLAYEKLGGIHLYDPKTGTDRTVSIGVSVDSEERRPQTKDLSSRVASSSISPSGTQVAVSARGFVFTVSASNGEVHVTDRTQGVHRRTVSWSPDGRNIAYITDVAGYRQIGLWDLGSATERRFDLGDRPSLYIKPVWSPDSSKIFYRGDDLTAWILDLKTGKSVKAWTWAYAEGPCDPVWSQDSRWLAYSDSLESHYHVIRLYSVDTGRSAQITDGMADAWLPIFDLNGRYLYFLASTHLGQAATMSDVSVFNNLNPVYSIYAVQLSKAPGAGSPMIDLDGIEDRVAALPVPAQLYSDLEPATGGSFYALSSSPVTGPDSGDGLLTASRFSWSTRSLTTEFEGISALQTTPDGSKALVSKSGSMFIVPTDSPSPLKSGQIDTSGLKMTIEPLKEWRHIFHEIWHELPLHYYSPTLNGIDPKQMEDRYAPFLERLASRDDLNYLIDDMLGEVCTGHEFPGGGDIPHAKQVSGGLLGADYEFSNGRFRIARVFPGDRWNPDVPAPLGGPEVDAKPGDYILEIDGKRLADPTDIYLSLENKAGKSVQLRIGPDPSGAGSRLVSVVPVADEYALRHKAWEENNRRIVEEETHGRAGYIHVPDTNVDGWVAFNRYYYAQAERDGIIVDERFNRGGLFNDFMIHEMQKAPFAYFASQHGADEPTPGAGVFGPKVMLIDEASYSGGDLFPWLFRQQRLGPLVGKRTWGGLITNKGFGLADGGSFTSPDFGFYDNRSGRWDIENWGVAPDIDVELDPFPWRQGKDSQLERSIVEMNRLLAKYRPEAHRHPPYPDRTKVDVHP